MSVEPRPLTPAMSMPYPGRSPDSVHTLRNHNNATFTTANPKDLLNYSDPNQAPHSHYSPRYTTPLHTSQNHDHDPALPASQHGGNGDHFDNRHSFPREDTPYGPLPDEKNTTIMQHYHTPETSPPNLRSRHNTPQTRDNNDSKLLKVKDGRVKKRSQRAERKGKAKQPGVPTMIGDMLMDRPLSELVTTFTDLVLFDVEAYVQRTAEQRQKEIQQGREPGKIKRPMNAYMLYRKVYQEPAKRWCGQRNHQVVSRVCGVGWHMEPPHIQGLFNRWAAIERSGHAKAFPDYKFTPSKVQKAKMRKDERVMIDEEVSEEYYYVNRNDDGDDEEEDDDDGYSCYGGGGDSSRRPRLRTPKSDSGATYRMAPPQGSNFASPSSSSTYQRMMGSQSMPPSLPPHVQAMPMYRQHSAATYEQQQQQQQQQQQRMSVPYAFANLPPPHYYHPAHAQAQMPVYPNPPINNFENAITSRTPSPPHGMVMQPAAMMMPYAQQQQHQHQHQHQHQLPPQFNASAHHRGSPLSLAQMPPPSMEQQHIDPLLMAPQNATVAGVYFNGGVGETGNNNKPAIEVKTEARPGTRTGTGKGTAAATPATATASNTPTTTTTTTKPTIAAPTPVWKMPRLFDASQYDGISEILAKDLEAAEYEDIPAEDLRTYGEGWEVQPAGNWPVEAVSPSDLFIKAEPEDSKSE